MSELVSEIDGVDFEMFETSLEESIGQLATEAAYHTDIGGDQLVIPRFAYPFNTEKHYED